MSVPVHNFEWEQGTDLVVVMTYKEGQLGSETVPANFNTWNVRMDIANATTGLRVWTFNSVATTDPVDNTLEGALTSDGKITITVPKALTLPSGAIYSALTGNPQVNVFNYDVLLRDPTNKQKKILKGTVTVNKTVTLWS